MPSANRAAAVTGPSPTDEPAAGHPVPGHPMIETISAVTLATADMARAVAFYERLGFAVASGGGGAAFTTLEAGRQRLNLTAESGHGTPGWWGRVIFHVADVDASWRAVVAAGIETDFKPRDAPWGERYFHLTDPDGHELSFARPLE